MGYNRKYTRMEWKHKEGKQEKQENKKTGKHERSKEKNILPLNRKFIES